MSDIQEKILELMDLFDEDEVTTANKIPRPQSSLDKEAFDDFNIRNPLAGGGMLVQPSADGSRPGYKGKKFVEVDGTKYRVVQKGDKKGKIVFRGRDPEGNQLTEYFNNKTDIKNRLEKGKKQNIDKQVKLKAESTADVNRVRNNIDNWTSKWVKDNFNKYEIQDNDKFIEDLKKAWSKESKKNIYKLNKNIFKSGFSRWSDDSISVLGFPNFTQVQGTSKRNPLKIQGIVKTAGNLETQPFSYDNFFKKVFFANKINSNKKLKNQFNKVFNFVNTDKSKLSQKQFIKAHGNFLTNLDPDVMYMLSDDALASFSRYDLFSKTFGKPYEKYRKEYIKKISSYFKTTSKIEKALGLPDNYITNQLSKEQKLLKKVFRVKSLPPAFQYSMDHGIGLAYAASTNDKNIMKQAVNTLIGMTNAQNQALGMGGWEKNRIKLLKNVKKDPSLLSELNAHMKLGYGDILPNQETFYKIEGTGKNTKIIPTFKGQNQPDRFKSYVAQISKQKVDDIKRAFQDKTIQKSILDFKKGNTKPIENLLKQIKAKNVKGVENALKQTGVKSSNAGFISRELLESAAKGIGNVGRVLAKYGILPELGFVGGDYLVRTQLGDSPKEAFLRASDFYRPGDQTKEAEILETSRFFGDKAGQLVGRVIDYEKQLAKIENLKQQKQSLENLTPTSDFSYLPDTSQGIKNIDDSIKQATIDLNNKFNMTEAERTYANRIREETDDARMATSNVAKTRLERSQSSNYRMSAPQAMKDMKSQADLNLNMFPSPPTIAFLDPEKGIQYKNLSESSFEDIQNYRQLLKDFNVEPPSSKIFLEKRDQLRGMLPSEVAEDFGAEQAYGASGTFFGQPLAGGGIAKIAGVDQGPPPESGPNSQGLKGLFKRAKNI